MDQSDNTKQTDESDFHTKFPNLDVAFDISNELVAKQSEEIKALNDSGNTILGTTTALLGTALVIQAVLLSRYPKNFLSDYRLLLIQGISLLTKLFLYLIALITNLLSHRLGRAYLETLNLETIYDNYLNVSEDKTKAAVFRVMVEFYKNNNELIRHKSRWVNFAYSEQIIMAVMLVSIILFQIYMLNYV